jgi:hypothetical protein
MVFPMHGQLVCYRHGGKAPNSIAFAKRRLIFDAVRSRVSRIVAYDGDDVTSPEEGLLMEVKWSGQVAIAYGEACEALIADEALTTKSAGARMQLHALMEAWTKERTNHARLCALALSAGIQQRQLDLVESQAVVCRPGLCSCAHRYRPMKDLLVAARTERTDVFEANASASLPTIESQLWPQGP